MFTSGTAGKIYLKCTAFFTAIFASLTIVFAPLIPTFMDLVGAKSFFGIDFDFSGKIEKSYVNVLLMGVDKSEALSDVMMIAQLNMANNSVNILQLPRDTYIEGRKGDKKLNSAYGSGGVKKTIEDIQTLVDIEIDGHVLVTTSGFRDVVDAVGGIYYDVPRDMNYDDVYQDLHIHLKKGYQLLDGDKAEQYVRYRSGYVTGDLGRIDAQSDFIKEAMRQILEKNASNSNEETKKLLASISKMVTTDFTFEEMLQYAPYILKIDMDKVNIMRLAGEAPPVTGNQGSFFYPDHEENARIVYEYFSPDTSEVDFSEVEARDKAKGKNSVSMSVSDVPSVDTPEKNIKVYLMDYSKTNGESLNTVRNFLEQSGYDVIGAIEANTCTSDETYVICKEGNVASKIAREMGLSTYTINQDLDSEADVVVIIGKDIE